MAAETTVVSWFAWLIGAIVLAGIFLVPVIWAVVHTSHRRRQWEHEERLRALEHGHPLPVHVPVWPLAFVCVMLGAVMPVGVFVVAWLADQRFWIAPVIVAVTGVLGASILGNRWLDLERSRAWRPKATVDGKPRMADADADAFDTVGRRG